ncbi:DUF5593 domain-containing protein [Nocardia sp. CDC159]|uniref:DUF5593 domain-containing protein n=1 Tax=Nocardia pulmonis TaxID=2951408 RepID=A0A9X2J0N8_9NOCA|nr:MULTISPECIES: GAF domain-containing protein [Nocardia]MCM6777220.1 DUF5593 domain-containing protein [Nocardia pulmonis]MCM6790105.1 DUF5593 domain-containing protein [Nocardia sp. CDC159]
MSDNCWLLVETLGLKSEPTVVADGHRSRDWTSLSRARRNFGAVGSRLVSRAVARASAGHEVDSRESDLRVVALPIRCAFGAIHGVETWIGESDQTPPPRRGIAAWDWLSKTELAHHGPGLEKLIWARAAEDVRVVRTPPEVFGRMVRFDRRLEYSAIVAGTDPSGRWQGEVEMRGDDDRVRCFQMIVRVHRDGGVVTRSLMHEISDVRSPQPTPELAVTRAAVQSDDVGVGFIELNFGVIWEWIRDPLPPLDRWAVERPEIHPDDLSAYRSTCREVAEREQAGAPLVLTTRVRFDGTDWIPVRMEISCISGALPQGIIRVSPAPPA